MNNYHGAILRPNFISRLSALSISSLIVALLSAAGLAASAQASTINYTYDELGRLTAVSDPVNGDRHYAYDAAGNRTRVDTTSGVGLSLVLAWGPALPAGKSWTSTLSWSSTDAVSCSGIINPLATPLFGRSGETQIFTGSSVTAILTCTDGNNEKTLQRTLFICNEGGAICIDDPIDNTD